VNRTLDKLRRRGPRLALVASALLVAAGLTAPAALAADDYTQSVTQLSSTQLQLNFTPTTPAVYVDVHYTGVPGAGQQNVRMTNGSGTWRTTVNGLSTGNTLDYWFTYEKSGPQYDTPHFTFTVGGSSTTVAAPTFSPPGGTYSAAQTVTISSATSGATIRYTVDGSTPTASSTLYSGPISVPNSRTVNAIALKSGSTTSPVSSASYTIGTQAGCPTQSDTPNFGSNVRIFDPSMSAATIQAQLDTDFNNQKDTLTAQFADRRVAHLFKPGTYNNVHDNVGFYTSVAGLGQNPGDVLINGDVTVDAFNASDNGVALQNFWRSAENMAVNPSGGQERWAVAQAAPFRRMDVRGGLQLYPASYGFASSGTPATPSSAAGTAASGTWSSPAPAARRRTPSRTRPRRRCRPRRSPATCLTCTSTAPASTACSCLPCAPTLPARAGRTAAPRARRRR
jgi:hypothetical protein